MEWVQYLAATGELRVVGEKAERELLARGVILG